MALRDPKAQRARAAKMLEMKILEGKTNKEIAKEFHVGEMTVKKAMTLARKGDIVVSFEDRLMNELLPLAHDAIRNSLMGIEGGGNAKIGLEIFKGAGIIRPHSGQTTSQVSADHDLSAYIVRKRQLALLEENTIDAQFTRSEQKLLTGERSEPDTADREGDGPEIDVRLTGSAQVEPPGAPENCAAGSSDAAPETR